MAVNGSGNGFVNNVFVPAKMIQGVDNGVSVCCVAVLSFNNKKSTWGWSAVKIKTH